jgi:hypothetical protein
MMGLYRARQRVFGSIGLYVDTATSTAWTYLYSPKTDLQMNCEDLVKVEVQSEIQTANTVPGTYPVLEFGQHITYSAEVLASHGAIQEIQAVFVCVTISCCRHCGIGLE